MGSQKTELEPKPLALQSDRIYGDILGGLGFALGTQEQFGNYGEKFLFLLSGIPATPTKGCDSCNTISQGRALSPGGIGEGWMSLEQNRSLQDTDQKEVLLI